ncbi:endonuclease/exonuclease/phosphatase family protein [Kribbella deserti]|uniref:Endonuclease/exonuclease/phosphatase family protein n=1 Tax=Kribbella deserti TaxID=1926257 RepID=A0ABV6QQT5_9ACTN
MPSVVAMVAALLMIVPTTASAGVRSIRVMTYNIHHAQGVDGVLDLERIAKVIEDSGAEVIGLQEVDRHWSERSEWVDQAAWLARRLHMHVRYAANLDLDPLTPGAPRRQYGTAILSRYPIKASGNSLLPKYPGQEQRGLLEATIRVRGRDIRFANTHLTHNNDAERQEQADRIAALVGSSDQPTLLVGDLNAVPTARPITTLTSILRDTWVEVGVGPGYTISAENPTKRIDYLLHSPTLHPRTAAVLPTLASDHLPVVATYTLH